MTHTLVHIYMAGVSVGASRCIEDIMCGVCKITLYRVPLGVSTTCFMQRHFSALLIVHAAAYQMIKKWR